MKNILDIYGTPADPALPEQFDQILSGPSGLRVERIVSCGQVTPPGEWYDQDWDEWVLVLEGEARLAFADGTETPLHRGDTAFLPAHCRHRVTFTSNPCVWLAVHCSRLTPEE